MTRLDRSAAWLGGPITLRRTALGVVIALVGGALAASFDVATRFPFESLPFVLVILVATLVGRRLAGAVAVVVATLLLDYYTLPPLHRINPGSRTEFWGLVAFAAVMIVAAQLVGWLESVGEEERLERERAGLLVSIGDVMSSASGPEGAIRDAARLLVPAFGDWVVVHLVREDGTIARIAAVHSAGEELERELMDSPVPDPAAERGVAAVIRTGQTERYASPSTDEVRRMTADERHLDVVMRAGLGSSIVAPLTAHERTFGALTVVRGRHRAAFSDREASLVEEIAERGALVLDNRRLAELERRTAGLNTMLQELTAALSAAVSASEVGRTVVEQGVRALSASAAVLGVRVPDGTIELREWSGYDADSIERQGRFSIEDPVPLSLAMRTGRTVVIRSLEERDRRFPALRGAPPLTDHALVCLPFIVRGSAIGGLAVTFEPARTFAEWEIGFMESIGAQAAQALDRARLFESERDANRRLETSADRLERLLMVAYRLSRAHDRASAAGTIVQAGVTAADAEAGSLMLVDDPASELVLETSIGYPEEAVGRFARAPLSSPLPTAESARTGHPVWLESPDQWAALYPAGYESTVRAGVGAIATSALPLVVGGRTLGVLELSYGERHRFDEDERDFLLTLAGLCAQNLQGALVLEERESARAEAERGRERIEFLAEATRLLSSSLDLEATIDELANLCVPRIADWMNISVLDGRDLRQMVLRHRDTSRLETVGWLQSRIPFDPDAPTGPARVVRTGESELVERIDDEMLKAAAPDAETLEALRELGLVSAVTVPLSVQERILGTLTLAYAESGRHYDRSDLTYIESLARRAAVAMDNARLFRDRENMSRSLQRSLLPRHLPSIPGVEMAVRYIPFGEGHDVGGDFYDAFSGLDDSWGLLIGDVCGKGPDAASIVGIARHTVRGLAMAHSRPSSILEALNRAILDESPSDRFCTACYVRLRRNGEGFRATIALGGHLPPLLLSAGGVVRHVGEPGSLLGVLEQPELSDVVVDLTPGDILLLYTDGLEEPGSTTAGYPTVEQIVARSAGLSADEVADELLRRVRPGGTAPRDDIAILALRILDGGEGAPPSSP